MADSARWEGFAFRDGDVVISTPAKCGTTWMQTIVGMLVLDQAPLDAPIGTLSPWLDMQIRTTAEVHELLAAQTHRRWIKTHTPLDGVPIVDGVTYLSVIRHPLDAALSDRDHGANSRGTIADLRRDAVGSDDLEEVVDAEEPPEDAGSYLRWWITREVEPTGSGPYSLGDFANSVRASWDRRHLGGVHLFHYDDLWRDLDGEMRRVATALGVEVPDARWPAFVEAATLDAMRARADTTAPEAHLGIWESSTDFFRVGGRRRWDLLLEETEIADYEARLDTLCGPAADWVRNGRDALRRR